MACPWLPTRPREELGSHGDGEGAGADLIEGGERQADRGAAVQIQNESPRFGWPPHSPRPVSVAPPPRGEQVRHKTGKRNGERHCGGPCGHADGSDGPVLHEAPNSPSTSPPEQAWSTRGVALTETNITRATVDWGRGTLGREGERRERAVRGDGGRDRNAEGGSERHRARRSDYPCGRVAIHYCGRRSGWVARRACSAQNQHRRVPAAGQSQPSMHPNHTSQRLRNLSSRKPKQRQREASLADPQQFTPRPPSKDVSSASPSLYLARSRTSHGACQTCYIVPPSFTLPFLLSPAPAPVFRVTGQIFNVALAIRVDWFILGENALALYNNLNVAPVAHYAACVLGCLCPLSA